jgi:hypothetical protein
LRCDFDCRLLLDDRWYSRRYLLTHSPQIVNERTPLGRISEAVKRSIKAKHKNEVDLKSVQTEFAGYACRHCRLSSRCRFLLITYRSFELQQRDRQDNESACRVVGERRFTITPFHSKTIVFIFLISLPETKQMRNSVSGPLVSNTTKTTHKNVDLSVCLYESQATMQKLPWSSWSTVGDTRFD